MMIGCSVADPSKPSVVDGRLDLTNWDFDADGDVALLGTWEVCWGQLIEPGKTCRSDWRPVPVRGIWGEAGVGGPFGGKGVATYRVRIALPPESEPLSVVVGGPLTAHRLWIDGIARGGVGVVGATAETTVAGVANRAYELEIGANEVEFQVQVANFVFRGGGLRRLWFLGHTDSIHRGMGRAVLREGTLFAVGVVVGLGFLALFALRPSERARGYFGLMALALGLRAIPASISGFGELMAPWMTWNFTVRAEYLGAAVSGVAFVGYARTKVAGIMPPRTMNALQSAAIAFGLVVAFAPMPMVVATLPIQYAFSIALIGLIILCYGRAWSRGLPGVGVTAATAVLYTGFIVHDIMRTIVSGFGAPIELFPYALVLWIFAEAYQILQGFHQSFEKVESLSDELSDANFELQETEAAIVRFVPFDFLRSLGKQSIREVHSGDHAKSELSVLYCGFQIRAPDGKLPDAAISGSMFERINELVGCLEPCVEQHAGFLNDYHGDGFHAFFPGGPADAVAAALEILAATRLFNTEAVPAARPSFDVNIGIDTGSVELGTIGSGEHLIRGVVGGPVDAARRIQSLTVGIEGKILISAATRNGLGEGEPFPLRALETLDDSEALSGAGSTEIYEVLHERSK